MSKVAIIIGAGPAGLTAAYELLHRTDVKPIIYEMSGYVGGISRTVNYKGNRIDIGGHRFFSKSDKVMRWWQNIMPLQGMPSKDDIILERNIPLSKELNAPNPEKTDKVMLIRSRLSRIFFLRKFFDYPVSLNIGTLKYLGASRIFKILMSYLRVRIFPIKNEINLECFFINRFGKELYRTFFKVYTEKVWGVTCDRIAAEWGAQRVKGLSIGKAILHSVQSIISRDKSVEQKNTETSLISQFMYPKLGPGQMWEEVVNIILEKGGELYLNHKVVCVKNQDGRVVEVNVRDEISGDLIKKKGDYFFSTMPVKELIKCLDRCAPKDVQQVADGLVYRDFITVGLLLKGLKTMNKTGIKTINNMIPDTWVYIQERDVKVGRLQVYNNWSPYMVKHENNVWLGLEYFYSEGDELWSKSDDEMSKFAIGELSKIDIINMEDVIDSVVIRVPKAYPAYFGSYDQFDIIKNYTNKLENLFLIGRNGMHRYNNQDHSMLTAYIAVDNILFGIKSKDTLWAVNTEYEYHESK